MSKLDRFKESSNPLFGKKAMDKVKQNDSFDRSLGRMTISGSVNKTFILFAILLTTTIFGYQVANPIFTIGGAIAGLVVVIIAVSKPERSVWAAPLYAALEGLFVGGVSFMYSGVYSGIIFQAVMLTFSVLFMMLFIYKTGIIKVTDKFRRGVVMATGAIMLMYLLSFVLGFFDMNVPFLHEGGMMGIGISLAIIGVASLNLLLDFDFIEKGEQNGYPQYMEWFGAMGLMITLVWLYIEILRLLSMLSSSD